MTATQSDEDRAESETEPYADDTPLTALFGTHAKTKILAALVSERDRDLNVSDIARLAGVVRSTVYEHLDELLAIGVIEETRTVGNGPMYQLNQDSPIAKRVYELEGLVLKQQLAQEGHLEEPAE